MKVMLVGEGPRELGSEGSEATGAVWIRRLLAAGPGHEIEIVPYVLARLRRIESGPAGEAENAARAVHEARRQKCDGLVFLRDADGDPAGRRRENELGFAAQGQAGPAVVLGVQVHTMETWLLADTDSFERVLGVKPRLPKRPEQIWGAPRTEAHPKEIYRRAVRAATGRDERATAVRLAEAADLDVLARECPNGFGRFKMEFEQAFKTFDCVVAADLDNGIGAHNGLPWPRLKSDLKHFKDTTCAAADGKRNAIIMGRKTWESIPAKQRPLPGRWTLVISRGEVELAGDARVARSLDDALTQASLADDIDQIFVVGGAEIYKQAFAHVRCRDVLLTRIEGRFEADAHIPDVADGFVRRDDETRAFNEAGFDFRIETWRRRGR